MNVRTLAIAGAVSFVPVDGYTMSSMTYEDAVALCQAGDRRGCAVAHQYLQSERNYNSGRRGSPADPWVPPQELQGEKRGVFSPGELAR